MKKRNAKLTNKSNKIKVGIAGLLLGATLITGSACNRNGDFITENDTSKETTVSVQSEAIQESTSSTSVRKDLTKIINNTFNEYIAVEGQNAGGTIILEDGTHATRRIGCVTAPNGDNVAWFGDEYYAIYAEGKTFLNENGYPEETEMYVPFKDALLDIVNDKYHIVTKLGNNRYQINDNDCNVYEFVIKDGKIIQIYDTYTDFTSGVSNASGVYLTETDEQEFVERLNEAIEQIDQADEYFNGLTK